MMIVLTALLLSADTTLLEDFLFDPSVRVAMPTPLRPRVRPTPRAACRLSPEELAWIELEPPRVEPPEWLTEAVREKKQICHRSEMSTIVKDCVHRFIRMSPLCRAFADTPEFQRLREIRQLGPVYLVYPGAVHTRLEHSLGVMHLAGEVVDVLRASGVVVSAREKDLVQLAGMLHDVGHVAYSHMLDHMLREAGHPGHEERSVELVERINARLVASPERPAAAYEPLSPSELATVQRMIVGDTAGAGDRAFLYEIVANRECGVDVDRFDYLQRDAKHTGVAVGFQPDYVIQCARVRHGRLSFLHKALPELRGMLEARARMFTLVYRHRTVVRIEHTIREIIADMQAFIEWAWADWMRLDDVELTAHLRRYPTYERMYARQWSGSRDPSPDQAAPGDPPSEQLARVRFV